jgi:histone H3/H4
MAPPAAETKRHAGKKKYSTRLKKAAACRIAKRAGVRTLSLSAMESARDEAEAILQHVVREAMVYCGHTKRLRLSRSDVDYATRKTGVVVYG